MLLGAIKGKQVCAELRDLYSYFTHHLKDSNVPWCYYKPEDMPSYTVDSVTTTTLGVKVCVLIFIANNHVE